MICDLFGQEMDIWMQQMLCPVITYIYYIYMNVHACCEHWHAILAEATMFSLHLYAVQELVNLVSMLGYQNICRVPYAHGSVSCQSLLQHGTEVSRPVCNVEV
jgi:hypothetical protein